MAAALAASWQHPAHVVGIASPPPCRCLPRRHGEKFDRQRHVCGTEVKAITYSAMQINETPEDAEVFVIVDI